MDVGESALMDESTNALLDEIGGAIRGAGGIALAGHVSPDADALASMGALHLALPELGKAGFAALPVGSISRRVEFIVALSGMKPATAEQIAGCDLAIVLDTAKEKRVNLDDGLRSLSEAAIVNIDHHASNTEFGRWNWVSPSASSTSELVYYLLRRLGCALTPTVATLLYAGIHSDTQGFSLTNTTPSSLAVGHALAAAGARIHDVCERLHRSHSREEFELLKTIYKNTRVAAEGRLAWSCASLEELAAAGVDGSAIDDQVEIPRSVADIAVAVLLTEGEPGVVRVNFRGEGSVSVLELAKQFGGGGHRASAGARIRGSLEAVVPRVISAAEAFVRALPPAPLGAVSADRDR